MKIEYKGIIFDEFTIEKINGEIIDISKITDVIEIKDIKGAWGYICKEHSDEHNFELHTLDESIEGMMCYVDGCKDKLNGVVDFYVEGEDIKGLKFILESVEDDIEKLTEEDYKINLKNLTNLKFEKVDWYDLERDNYYNEVVNNKPKFVDFNSVPYDYNKAVIKAINELYEMFLDCNSYEDARKIILADENLCSRENGYSVFDDDNTGNLYIGWAYLRGNDTDRTIYWDVRWY